MNKKLNNIFVTVDVAKLAKEKGFNEWCACLYANEIGLISHSDDCYQWNTSRCEPSTVWLRIPTHFQLIEWLLKEKKIYVCRLRGGLFLVQGVDLKTVYDVDRRCMFEINEALELALNQIQNGN